MSRMNALIVIAQDGYQDHEFEGTRVALEAAGCAVVIASEVAGPCTGKLGGIEMADVALRDVNVLAYDRIAFIGGPGAHALVEHPDAHRIAREAVRNEIPLGAICIAPLILAAAGVLKGKAATVWDAEGEQAAQLERAGASYTADPVTVSGRIVTANGPAAADAFGEALAALRKPAPTSATR